MGKQPLVVFLGDSTLIDSVAFSLRDSRVLSVTRIDTLTADIEERLASLKPDLVVFELDSPYSPLVLSCLRERPCIQLVGLDLTHSRVIVLDSQQLDNPTLDDLCRMIQTKVSESVHWKGGSGN